MKRDDALIAKLADLNEYIAAVHRVAAEWEQDEIADQMEIRPHVEHEIQDWVLRQLISGVQIYLKPPVSVENVYGLVSMCRRCIKPTMGSSVRLSKVLERWLSEQGIELTYQRPWEDKYHERWLYGEIAAAAIDLACDVYSQSGALVIRNAEWKTE